MDQISQDALCLVDGHCAFEGRYAILAVRASEFLRDKALERPRATATERRLNAGRCSFAFIAEKDTCLLRTSASDTIGRVEQLNQRINQDPNRVHDEGK